MPSSFAELWLRIYTKDGKFHGLIQAAYRHILKQLVSEVQPAAEEEHEDGFDPDVLGGPATAAAADDDLGLQPVKVFRPESPALGDSPATPRTFTRTVSTGSAVGVGSGPDRRSRALGRASSFSENRFTAVPPNFRSESPTRKPRSKRGREVSDNFESGRPKKSVRLSGESSDKSTDTS